MSLVYDQGPNEFGPVGCLPRIGVETAQRRCMSIITRYPVLPKIGLSVGAAFALAAAVPASLCDGRSEMAGDFD